MLKITRNQLAAIIIVIIIATILLIDDESNACNRWLLQLRTAEESDQSFCQDI